MVGNRPLFLQVMARARLADKRYRRQMNLNAGLYCCSWLLILPFCLCFFCLGVNRVAIVRRRREAFDRMFVDNNSGNSNFTVSNNSLLFCSPNFENFVMVQRGKPVQFYIGNVQVCITE